MKKFKYSFAPDANAKGGVAAAVAAAVSLTLLVVSSVVSFAFEGEGGYYLGAAGLFSFLLSVYGFYLGIKSFSEKHVNHRYSIIGSLSSGILAVLWLGIFLAGIS